MKNLYVLLSILFTFYGAAFAQNVGIGTNAPHNSAMLDIQSTTKGMLVPRLTTIQRNAIATPANGLLVYDSDSAAFMYFNGLIWQKLAVQSTQTNWSVKGNSTTHIDSNFIGTLDNQGIRFKTNNIHAGLIDHTKRNYAIGRNAGVDNTSGQGNIAIGNAALKSNKIQSGQVAIGDSALYALSRSSLGIPSSSVAIGYKTLLKDTVGIRNVAIGYESQKSSVNGSANTTLGYNSLSSNVSGSSNTAIGSEALSKNISSSNTAIGTTSLSFNVNGVRNTSLGAGALGLNPTGSDNISIGFQSMLDLDSGDYNIAIGNYAQWEATINSGNTSIGYTSLLNNLTGNYNTSMGISNLTDNTTGLNNTSVGSDGLTKNRTGNNNSTFGFKSNVRDTNQINSTAIGALARVDTSNAVVIGSVNGINGATATVNVGIGTSKPTERLDVLGKIKTTQFQLTTGAANNYILKSDANGNASWTMPVDIDTDSQSISLSGTNLSISRGNSINLAPIVTDSQSLSLSGTNLSISRGNTINLSTIETDPQVSSTLTNMVPRWNGTTLVNGNIFNDSNAVAIGTTSPGNNKLSVAHNPSDLNVSQNGFLNNVNLNGTSTLNGAMYGMKQYVDISNFASNGRMNVSGNLQQIVGSNTMPSIDTIIGIDMQVSNMRISDTNKNYVSGIKNYIDMEASSNGVIRGIDNSLLLKNGGSNFTGRLIGFDNKVKNLKLYGTSLNKHNVYGIVNDITEQYANTGEMVGIDNTINFASVLPPGENDSVIGIRSIISNSDLFSKSFGIYTKISGSLPNSYGLYCVGEAYNYMSGRLGIGTNNPSHELQVIGTSSTTNFRMTNGATNNYILKSDASGNASWVAANTLETDPQVGTITNNYISRWNGTALVNSGIQDDSTNIGIGTAPISGQRLSVSGKTTTTNFQMTTGATNNYILRSDASGNASWVAANTLETDPQVGTITNNYISRWNGSSLVNGSIQDDSTNIGIGTAPISGQRLSVSGKTTTTNFQMTSGASNNYILSSDASGNASWVAANTLETDPQVGTITNNYISRWNGSSLVNGSIQDDSTNIGIGTAPISGQRLSVSGKTTTTNFQMTSGASNNYILSSDASGNASWVAANTLETDPQVGTITNNYISRWNGTALVNSSIQDDSTNIGIGTAPISGQRLSVSGKTTTTNFQMTTGATNNYILRSDASGNASWVAANTVEVDPQVASVSTNAVPRWNGTSLTDGAMVDNTTSVGVGANPSARLDVFSGNIRINGTENLDTSANTGADGGVLIYNNTTGLGGGIAKVVERMSRGSISSLASSSLLIYNDPYVQIRLIRNGSGATSTVYLELAPKTGYTGDYSISTEDASFAGFISAPTVGTFVPVVFDLRVADKLTSFSIAKRGSNTQAVYRISIHKNGANLSLSAEPFNASVKAYYP